MEIVLGFNEVVIKQPILFDKESAKTLLEKDELYGSWVHKISKKTFWLFLWQALNMLLDL